MSIFTNPSSRSAEQGRAYTQAVIGLVGDADPMDLLRAAPGRFREAVRGVPQETLSTAEAPGKWSARMVLRHMADSEGVWWARIRMVLAHDRPRLEGYDQDAWAERLGYGEADVAEALEEFALLRRGNLRVLERATEEDLARIGVHGERGEESLGRMIRLYAGHDLVHLRQLERILGSRAP